MHDVYVGGKHGIEKNPSDKCTCDFFLRLFSCFKDFQLFPGEEKHNNCLRFEPTSQETANTTSRTYASSVCTTTLFVFFIAKKFFLVCTPRNQTTMDLMYVRGPKTQRICTHTISTSQKHAFTNKKPTKFAK